MSVKGHSVKVPRLYKVAASILKSVKAGQGSVKNLVYEAKKKHPNVKALFALVSQSLQNEPTLCHAFDEVKLLANEKPLDCDLALILATELLYGKKTLPGDSKPVQTILKYQKKLAKFIVTEEVVEPKVQRPRYVRVNGLKSTIDLMLAHFKREGLMLKDTPKKYEDFIEATKNLQENEFHFSSQLECIIANVMRASKDAHLARSS